MISDDGKGRLLMTAHKHGGLWRMDIHTTVNESSVSVAESNFEIQAIQSRSDRDLQRWHYRLGHVNVHTSKKMAWDDVAVGLPSLKKGDFKSVCRGCSHGKIHRTTFPMNTERKRACSPGQFFHSDISGPFQIPSFGGHRYFITFKDDHSSFRFIFFLKNRQDILASFKTLYHLVKCQTGVRISKLRTDNGSEYLSKVFQHFLSNKGIQHDLTAPYCPEQNGVAERDNRTIVESARSMLLHRNMPLESWGEAVNTAVYILNRVSSRTILGSTPFQLWYGEKPDISHCREFGSLCYSHIPKQRRQKLDSKARELLFMGYCATTKAYRLWCHKTKKIIVSRDIIFDEDSCFQFSVPASGHITATKVALNIPSTCGTVTIPNLEPSDSVQLPRCTDRPDGIEIVVQETPVHTIDRSIGNVGGIGSNIPISGNINSSGSFGKDKGNSQIDESAQSSGRYD